MTSPDDSHTTATTAARQLAQIAVDLLRARTSGEVLDRVVQAAIEVVPGCERASITLGDGDRFWTPVATDGEASAFDELQYRLGEGPCLDALERPVVVAQGNGWNQWPGFATKKPADLAVVVSCGLALRTQPAAALNLYTAGIFGGGKPGTRSRAGVTRLGRRRDRP